MESKIVGYRGIANSDRVIISGHAFEKHKVRDVHPHHGRRRNLKQTIRRFRAKPLKMTAIDVTINGTTKRVRTNKKGFFTCEVIHGLKESGWYPYELYWKRNDKRFASEFYLSDHHETGVISDIDDTLLVSHSTRLIRKIVLQLFRNAYTRKTIPFVKNWHVYIKDMNDTSDPRDFFYVSNSEWNLYDFLVDFFSINELPKGVFFLQNLKKGLRDLISSGKVHHNHKQKSIEFLLRFYPEKKFILVGDNGQKDMEIYYEIVSKFHDRIKGVMIRKLAYIKNEKLIQSFKEKINHFDVPFLTFH
ncbi:MAG: App1 family protein [Cyclobacteriaceae bacterium]|nr:App1 family protein [Cyclobacteriaceae bacterium]MCK5704361.1 App1 family protein [Cyclobacteriaceae bacterium]